MQACSRSRRQNVSRSFKARKVKRKKEKGKSKKVRRLKDLFTFLISQPEIKTRVGVNSRVLTRGFSSQRWNTRSLISFRVISCYFVVSGLTLEPGTTKSHEITR